MIIQYITCLGIRRYHCNQVKHDFFGLETNFGLCT